ncbi:MAG: hypothetical protein WKF59_01840 [Chitinophagaceae bacterium]
MILSKVNLAFMTSQWSCICYLLHFVLLDLLSYKITKFPYPKEFMARIICNRLLAVKRTGIAVTDPLQIIATGLTTVDSKELIPF